MGRNSSLSNSYRLPNRCFGCAWAFFAIPCKKVDMDFPALHVRFLSPVQAASSRQPLPLVIGSTVSEYYGLV
jgi:hypothetical protein